MEYEYALEAYEKAIQQKSYAENNGHSTEKIDRDLDELESYLSSHM